MTTTTTRWSSASGTPDPVHRPADPFFMHVDEDAPAPTRTVRDNIAFAWRNSSQVCFDDLPDYFVSDWREAMDAAATAAFETVLPAVWRERGYVMLACTDAAMGDLDRDLPDSLYHEVWDAAANRLDGHALAEAAGLGQQLLDYQDTDTDRDY